MINFKVEIKNRIAAYSGKVRMVSENSGYNIEFDTDSEWDEYRTKTARFVVDGELVCDKVFFGKVCEVPALPEGLFLYVSLSAGDVLTTSAAKIPLTPTLAADRVIPPPEKSVYNQIMEMMHTDYSPYVDRAESAADKAEAASKEALVNADLLMTALAGLRFKVNGTDGGLDIEYEI